ncbi:MAG: acetylornithine/succinylornithine family transaminase [Candidatus Methanoplasma sp.]|jgi:acetylornithine aminotransferase/acetylornithine/N-succinyldiaminopimelate aminotransferase|nr:acetylornithine/succinylornithine family transaminase [Candidatus Methanoplasma sp.]
MTGEMSQAEVEEASSKYLFQNYSQTPLAFERGEGAYLYGLDGRRYLDLVAGIAVNAIGYSHPEWVARMSGQISRIAHCSNLYMCRERAELGERLASIAPGGLCRSLFVNSGAEANEGAMKMAVRYTGRGEIASALNGFHGRTAGSLGATGQEKYRQSFEPLISGAYRYYRYGDAESVKEVVGRDTAALLYEPIQGEGGVVSADPSFYKALRDICTDNGTVLVADEVQTGMGRTGKWFCTEHYGVTPDVITVAKGLGGGLPLGAVLATEELAKVMVPGTHGTTFGGNPLVCASGCAVIDIIEEEGLLDKVSRIGGEWISDLRAIGSDRVREVRGRGFLIGAETDSEETAKGVRERMMEAGILVNVCHGSVIRLIPPLILSEAQRDEFTRLFAEFLS